MNRLADRVTVVTGATSGIGRAIALRFGREGARVIVADNREIPRDGSSPTVHSIRSEGGVAEYIATDVSQSTDVSRMVDFAVTEFGALHVLVNNAGVLRSTSVLNTTESDWDELMHVNLRGQFLASKMAIKQMLKQPRISDVRGRIVNITSQHGMVGPPELFAYAVSKGGMVQMTRQLAVDFGRRGILVNAVAPGRILTEDHDAQADPHLDYSRARTPFPRLGRPDDVAGAALFLASDDCSFVSGHNLLVDGGWMAF